MNGGEHRRAAIPIAVALGLGLLLWVAWWSLQTSPPRIEGPGAREAAPVVPGALAGAAANPAPAVGGVAEAAIDRRVEAAPVGPTSGSLRVQVFWDEKRTAADDVLIRLLRSGGSRLFDMRYARSDSRGVARFEALRPGRVYVHPHRGGNRQGAYVEIVAGQEAEAAITLGPGMDARGIVVDGRGAPVAAAELLVVDWGGGLPAVLGHSGPDGRFLLRAVGTHCSIGASAPGFAPSPMRTFTGSKGGEVEFTIRLEGPGGALEGTVSGPGGQPLAGAIVRVGSWGGSITLPDGSHGRPPLQRQAITDAEGRFHFEGLPVGPMPLAARARALASLTREIELPAGRTLTLDLRLQPGVTLIGAVRDGAGRPVEGAELSAGDSQDLAYETGRSDADGTFRLEGLPAGELELEARGEEHGRAATKLPAVPGQTVRWDVVFPALQRVLSGRVLDHLGKPAERVMIEARHSSPSWFGFASTDAEGRFALRDFAADAALVITVRRISVFPEVQLEGVRPGSEELLVRLPKPAWIHIRGEVLDPGGKPLANVHVSPTMKGSGSPAATTDATTGAFDLGPYPPGEYSLRIAAVGYPPVYFPTRPIAPDEVWEVGTVQLQHGGFVAASLLATDGRDLPESRLDVFDAAGGMRVGNLHLKEGRGRAGPLAPGEYLLQVALPGMACVRQPFTIRAKETTPLDLPLQPGIPVVVAFSCAEEEGRPSVARTHAHVVLTGPEDAVVLDRWVAIRGAGKLPGGVDKDAFVPPLGGRLEIMLLPGRYRLAATTTSGPDFAGEAVLEVAGPGPVEAKVVLRAR